MERIRNQIIQALCEREMSIYELIDHQDASIPEFFNLIRKMEDEGILSVENGFVRLKDRNVCEGLDGFEVYCKICDGTGYEIRKPLIVDFTVLHQAKDIFLTIKEDLIKPLFFRITIPSKT